jgi:phosphoenolpyruvate carboxykinase (ATP)
MITAALNGSLDSVDFEAHPIFGMLMPKICPNVPKEILHPRYTWNDRDAYDATAKKLASMFIANFEKYASGVSQDILNAAPKI